MSLLKFPSTDTSRMFNYNTGLGSLPHCWANYPLPAPHLGGRQSWESSAQVCDGILFYCANTRIPIIFGGIEGSKPILKPGDFTPIVVSDNQRTWPSMRCVLDKVKYCLIRKRQAAHKLITSMNQTGPWTSCAGLVICWPFLPPAPCHSPDT
jgi:hypothetical protein